MAYLVLSRHAGEKIDIITPGGHRLEIVVTEIRKGKVRLGIAAPKDFIIARREITDLRVPGEPDPETLAALDELQGGKGQSF